MSIEELAESDPSLDLVLPHPLSRLRKRRLPQSITTCYSTTFTQRNDWYRTNGHYSKMTLADSVNLMHSTNFCVQDKFRTLSRISMYRSINYLMRYNRQEQEPHGSAGHDQKSFLWAALDFVFALNLIRKLRSFDRRTN